MFCMMMTLAGYLIDSTVSSRAWWLDPEVETQETRLRGYRVSNLSGHQPLAGSTRKVC